MLKVSLHHFSDAPALSFGLDVLCAEGLTPRGLLYLAIDGSGSICLGVPERARDAIKLRVGDKLALRWPGPEGLFHFDAVHCLRAGHVLFAGDRRLPHPGGSDDVAGAISVMLRQAGVRSAFFGYRPHAPGTWVASRHGTEALHDAGFDGVVLVDDGMALARRFMDAHLHLIRFADPRPPVEIVFDSPLGNILFLERRIARAAGQRLVLSCQGGLVEVDVHDLPRVHETARLATDGKIAVVGRLSDPAWAISRGRPVAWGLDDLEPITIMRVAEPTLDALGEQIERHWF